MPTGYTAAIEDGITFEAFVMQCARGMGALVTMRDDPWDAPIPERFEPSDYHAKALDAARAKLDELRDLTAAESARRSEAAYKERACDVRESTAKREALRAKYEEMLAKVKAWTPPTSDHDDFKRFMVEQIEQSIRFDCGWTPDPPEWQSGEEWRRAQIESAERDIGYHTDAHAAEVKRADERTRWVAALRASLAGGAP